MVIGARYPDVGVPPTVNNLVRNLALAFPPSFSTLTVDNLGPNVAAGLRGTLLPSPRHP
jgi:hypothetical protein